MIVHAYPVLITPCPTPRQDRRPALRRDVQGAVHVEVGVSAFGDCLLVMLAGPAKVQSARG